VRIGLVFQPTHPHGVRREFREAGGVVGCCSNPRTRTGCDAIAFGANRWGAGFQPTHPHGVRRKPLIWVTTLKWSSNPRTRTGCDLLGKEASQAPRRVPTHAPARGATRWVRGG